MRLVDDWKHCWKWLSMHFMVIATAIPPAWAVIPADLQATIFPEYVAIATAIAAACGIIGRLIDQPQQQPGPPQ